jgi:hypothetical protein
MPSDRIQPLPGRPPVYPVDGEDGEDGEKSIDKTLKSGSSSPVAPAGSADDPACQNTESADHPHDE